MNLEECSTYDKFKEHAGFPHLIKLMDKLAETHADDKVKNVSDLETSEICSDFKTLKVKNMPEHSDQSKIRDDKRDKKAYDPDGSVAPKNKLEALAYLRHIECPEDEIDANSNTAKDLLDFAKMLRKSRLAEKRSPGGKWKGSDEPGGQQLASQTSI